MIVACHFGNTVHLFVPLNIMVGGAIYPEPPLIIRASLQVPSALAVACLRETKAKPFDSK